MAAPASLIPELEEVLQNGSAERRARTLQRITSLFLNGADHYNEDHVELFDGVFMRLIEEIETKARAELAHRLAPVGNAPLEAVRRLAKDDDIAVAGPVLEQSPRLPEADLVDIARTKSQAHLLAISGRTGIAESVTDELVRRGDRHVVRSVADNRQARLSERGFTTLVRPGGRRRNPGREGRHASGHSAAPVPRTVAEGDGGRAAAPDRRRQARDAGGNPPRAGQGVERSRHRQVARLRRRRACGRNAASAGQAQRSRARGFRRTPASTKRWSPRCRGFAWSRSMWWIA